MSGFWQSYCKSRGNLTVWSDGDFGQCFEEVAIICPCHIILAVISAFFLPRGIWRVVSYTKSLPWFVRLRFVISSCLTVLPIIQAVVLATFEKRISISGAVTCSLVSFSWLLHSAFVYRLKFLYWMNFRGPIAVFLAYSLIFISCGLHLRTVIHRHIDDYPQRSIVEESCTYCAAVLIISLLLTIIPRGTRNVEGVSPQNVNSFPSEVEPLSGAPATSYGSVGGTLAQPVIAEKNTSCLSKLTFYWVKPLMVKGAQKNIRTADDLYLLPERLNTSNVEKRFEEILSKDTEPNFDSNISAENERQPSTSRIPQVEVLPRKQKTIKSLLRALNSTYGIEYYSLGILKLLADCFGFAGPILLNFLVTFMESSSEKESHGYYYATGLLCVTFLAAVCSTHFDYNIKVVGFKIRASIISTIYRKALSVSSVNATRFTSGEIVNFMSTDTDRIINFCPSFHAFWSLPFQIGVSLYLLHQQVGLAFLAGLAFAIILVPVNKWLAQKIGQLSAAMMEQKDTRVKIMNEILYGMRVVKFYAWEEHFRNKIENVREAELKNLKGRKYLDAMCVYFWATTPVLISILTFTTYSLMGNQLTAAKVFTSLSLFLMLISPLNAFPWVINGLMEAWVSLKRVQAFVALKDVDWKNYYVNGCDLGATIALRNGHFSWKDDNAKGDNSEMTKSVGTLELQDISLVVEKGQFVGVIGKVGSGKSSLLSAVLSEMKKVEGLVFVDCLAQGFALVGQEAWIQHDTVKENILFGRRFRRHHYQAVVSACALLEDFKMLPAGDHTEIGENGVTLSGGQKSRVALARAVYQDKDVYLLDDPLAAVDAHVAQHLYEKCIMGLLKKKTRILCTHHTKYLRQADIIVVMDNGKITKIGSPSEILESVETMMEEDLSENRHGELTEVEDKQDQDGGLVGEEEMEMGVVRLSVYKSYWIAVGTCLAPMVLLSLFFMQASRNINDWWLSYWVSHSHIKHSSNYTNNHTLDYLTGEVLRLPSEIVYALSNTVTGTPLYNITDAEDTVTGTPLYNITDAEDNIKFYLTVYGCLAGANSIFTLIRAFLFAYGGICAARLLHTQLLGSVLRAPISFFDVTPVGRILNRFSSDLYSIDDSLPFIMNIFLAQLYGILGTVVVTCYGLPWFTLLLVPLGFLYYKIQQYYRHTSREIKRISSVTLSPIYAHFSETITGLTTIRAFRETTRFQDENIEKLDVNQRAQFNAQAAASWLGFWLQMLGVIVVAGIAFIAVVEHHFESVDPGLVGLAISYSLAVTNLLNGVVNSFTETEKQMVSVERARQYIDTIPAERQEGMLLPPSDWPRSGIMSFKNVSMRYRQTLPNAISNVNFITKPAEKIGIVGRTGSGKSSLFLVLFRMVDIDEGEINVDGVDLQYLDLRDIRSHFAIIPQDPFLFSGTVRENIDPRSHHTDSELWMVLEKCHLQSAVERLGGLEAEVAEKGRCLSVGQRQLLCLARAMLTKAKILCIDEATASVDLETDLLLQTSIRSEFQDSTVITIAHRINTVMDSDRVLVMHDGHVAEFSPPDQLLQDSQSLFYKLVHANR